MINAFLDSRISANHDKLDGLSGNGLFSFVESLIVKHNALFHSAPSLAERFKVKRCKDAN